MRLINYRPSSLVRILLWSLLPSIRSPSTTFVSPVWWFDHSQFTWVFSALPESAFLPMTKMGFPSSSAGKESACNTRDALSIPGSGSSPGERTGYLLKYSWASLVAQMAQNPPAMKNTQIWYMGCEDPLEDGMATHSSILAWRILWTEEPGGL